MSWLQNKLSAVYQHFTESKWRSSSLKYIVMLLKERVLFFFFFICSILQPCRFILMFYYFLCKISMLWSVVGAYSVHIQWNKKIFGQKPLQMHAKLAKYFIVSMQLISQHFSLLFLEKSQEMILSLFHPLFLQSHTSRVNTCPVQAKTHSSQWRTAESCCKNII